MYNIILYVRDDLVVCMTKKTKNKNGRQFNYSVITQKKHDIFCYTDLKNVHLSFTRRC